MIKNKRIVSFNVVLIALLLISIVLSIFVFPTAYERLIQSFKDIGSSVVYYVCEMFGIDNDIIPGVANRIPIKELPPVITPPTEIVPPAFPDTFDSYKIRMSVYGELLIDGDNISAYCINLANILKILISVLSITIPLIILLVVLFKRLTNKENTKHNIDTLPLRVAKKINDISIVPIKRYIVGLYRYLTDVKVLRYLLITVWVLNSNILTVLLEGIAFYLYFVMSFDVGNLYIQLLKLISDLTPIIRFIPVFVWLILGYIMFDRMRKKIGYMRLNHCEKMNCGMISELPICLMICGTMGKGKTKLMTDMALSEENILRRKALEMILEIDIKFSFFPWIVFEDYLNDKFDKGDLYNLASIKRHVNELAVKFYEDSSIPNCFGYDYVKYGLEYNDKLKVIDIWQALENYAQAYFIYICQSSYIQSNYGIRVDTIIQDLGNFPIWNMDFFKRDSRLMEAYSRHSKILNFDSLRLGRRLNDKYRGLFEFGVIVITEIAKERGNMLDTKEDKKSAEVCNRVNDMFNQMIKMIRHLATVDTYPFVKLLCDDQRAMSLGADARELCQIVNIDKSGERHRLMPFFFFEDMLHDILYSRFNAFYLNQRHIRGDNTLLVRILKTVVSKFNNYVVGVNNTFGSMTVDLSIVDGADDKKSENKKYYLSTKKIYSVRYATDCFSEYFAKQLLKSVISINTMSEYKSINSAFEDFKKQYSHFITDLEKIRERKQ